MNPTQKLKEAIEALAPHQSGSLLYQFIGLLDHAASSEDEPVSQAAQWAITQLTYLAQS